MTDRERLLEQVDERIGDAEEYGSHARAWMTREWIYLRTDEDCAKAAGESAKRAAHHALTAMALREVIEQCRGGDASRNG